MDSSRRSATNQKLLTFATYYEFYGAELCREGDAWKKRMETWNLTPAPAVTSSPATTPEQQIASRFEGKPWRRDGVK
jgi:hypothetical protein